MTEIEDTIQLMSIISRCEEYGECLLWTGAVGHSGHPIYKPIGGKCCTHVRRDVYRMTMRDPIPGQPIDTTCDEKLCLNAGHLFQSTTSKIAIKAAKRGAFSSMARKAKIAASRRGKMKLTLEIAREIRTSTETGPVLAERYGVNRSLVNNIKRGYAWKEYSSPFSGLMR